MSRIKLVFLLSVVLLMSVAGIAQQTDIPRYDYFGGFSYLASPKLNLYQRGFNGETGVNVRPWLAMGVDYSYLSGSSRLFAKELDPSKQTALGTILGGLPPQARAAVAGALGEGVPFEATTQTFSAGPQVNIRKWKPVTFFVRPALGILHEEVAAHNTNTLLNPIVAGLVPGGTKNDTTLFYGVGGGFDLNVNRNFGLRVGVDFVHTFLFEGFLAESRNQVRISVGPTIRWGKNIREKL